MPFHIEISSPFNRTRVFNVDEETVGRLLAPWVASLSFELGNHRWDPRESRLTILEGPLPASPDLNPEQTWAEALRAAEDVTRPQLEAAEASASPVTAMLIEADSAETALRQLRDGKPPQQIQWSDALERVEGRDRALTALILVVKPSGRDWLQI